MKRIRKKKIRVRISNTKLITEGLKVQAKTKIIRPAFKILLLFVNLESKNFLFLGNSLLLNVCSEKSFNIK